MMCQKVFVVGIFIASVNMWEKLGICFYAPISTYLHNVALMWKVHHFNLGLCGDWLEPSSSGHVRNYSFWHFHISFIFQPRRFLLEKTTCYVVSQTVPEDGGDTILGGTPATPLALPLSVRCTTKSLKKSVAVRQQHILFLFLFYTLFRK